MKRKYVPGGALAVLLCAVAVADDPRRLPPCEPGFQWVEVVENKEVVRYVCKTVPDVKKVKKIVYSTKDDPYCVQRGPSLLDSFFGLFHAKGAEKCDTCDDCKGPYMRKILVKTEITTEEPGTKCVTEKIVDVVPQKTWKKVRCTSGESVAPVRP